MSEEKNNFNFKVGDLVEIADETQKRIIFSNCYNGSTGRITKIIRIPMASDYYIELVGDGSDPLENPNQLLSLGGTWYNWRFKPIQSFIPTELSKANLL